MSDKGPLSPGIVFGKFGRESGNSIRIYSFGPKLFDMDGKEQHGIWDTTQTDGFFYIEFQWDPVEIARFIDPETGKFKFVGERKAGEEPEYYYGKFYLVLNPKYLFEGGRPTIKDAPPETEEWIKKVMDFVKKFSSFAKKVLSHAKLFNRKMLTTEMWCATGFIYEP